MANIRWVQDCDDSGCWDIGIAEGVVHEAFEPAAPTLAKGGRIPVGEEKEEKETVTQTCKPWEWEHWVELTPSICASPRLEVNVPREEAPVPLPPGLVLLALGVACLVKWRK